MTATSATRWVLGDRNLDFAAVDVLAARDDHVLLAIDQKDVALLVRNADVAGVVPAIANGFERCDGIVPVAVEHHCRTHHDFARLAWRTVLAIVIEQSKLNVRHRMTGRTRADESDPRVPFGFTSCRGRSQIWPTSVEPY